MADKKTGRPRLAKEIKKSISLKVMLNEEDNQKLIECAESRRLSKAATLLVGLDMLYAEIQNQKKNNG